MHDDQPQAARSITLLGGGPVDPVRLDQALNFAPTLVAADGGAKHARHLDHPVSRIVGDLDSLTNLEFWRDQGVEVVEIAEQNSTDFEKCLRHEDAVLFLGVGFLGRRLDHSLACLRTLAAYPDKKVILIGDADIVFLAPPAFSIDLNAGDPVSLFPMGPVDCGPSSGLRWPIDGLHMVPDGQIGTSNAALGGAVEMTFDHNRPLVILPINTLDCVIDAL